MAGSQIFKVVVADDYRVSRLFLETQVRDNERCKLSASFSNADSAGEYCSAHSVDLVIMDVLMRRGSDGIAAAARIKENDPGIKIILATSTAEIGWIDRARQIGVESFWYKEYSEESLADVIARTLDGESVYPDSAPRVAIGKTVSVALTRRDLDVLREMMLGLTNEEVAERLDISVNTVRTHVQNILNKTGFKNRLELIVHAASLGIVVNGQHSTLLES